MRDYRPSCHYCSLITAWFIAVFIGAFMKLFLKSLLLFAMSVPLACVSAAEYFCPKGSNPDSNVIWCDSFENEDLGPGSSVGENYYDFSPGSDPENMVRINSESVHGSYALKNHWNAGAGLGSTGGFMRTFGRNPVNSLSHSTKDFDEVYWRMYIKLQDGFIGQPDKLTRATIFAKADWSQAIIAHLWAPSGLLEVDPARGIDASGQLKTSGWNDFVNLDFIGADKGINKLVPGAWHCIEAHVKLNTPSASDGVFEFWIDDKLQAGRSDLNWRYSWQDYGINTIIFSDYWGAGSPIEQERYLDAIVISTKRVGCLDGTAPPKPPSNITIE